MLHREDVLLSFDALFGPDVADVASWQESAIAFVDKLRQPQGRQANARLQLITESRCDAEHRTWIQR